MKQPKLFSDISKEVFPPTCLACSSRLEPFEHLVCSSCQKALPKTDFLAEQENPVSELFYGRVYLHKAASLYYFHKSSTLQQLLHVLKYQVKPELGILLGKMAGKELLNYPDWLNFDYLIPIPLHPDKQKLRGYNQSEEIATGMSSKILIPVCNDLIFRNVFTETQTRKNKQERWENMQDVFSVAEDKEKFTTKHFLLIDDVLTTGATLESAANTLLQIPEAKVSVFTLALASH
jgi:ComF family protein